MKLYELDFTLLREFEELEGLFDLFNQMVIVKGNHLTVSVKSEKDVNFIEIYLYSSSEIPLIGIIRDLESLPCEDVLHSLSTTNFKKVFLKFSITDSKNITIEVFKSAYEYVSKNKEKTIVPTVFDDTAFEELLSLNFSMHKPLFEVSDLICCINSMLTNNCFSFVELRNKYFAFCTGMGEKHLTLNFFTKNISRPSLLLNVLLHGELNKGDITKYNMLCSQSELCSQPECSIQIFLDIQDIDDEQNVILKAHVYAYRYSACYNKIQDQCKLIDSIL